MSQSGGYTIRVPFTNVAEYMEYLRRSYGTTGFLLIPGQKRGICATDAIITVLWYSNGFRELLWNSFILNQGGTLDTKEIELWTPDSGKPRPTYSDYLRLMAHRLLTMYTTPGIASVTAEGALTRSSTNKPKGAPIDLGEECSNLTDILSSNEGFVREEKAYGSNPGNYSKLVSDIIHLLSGFSDDTIVAAVSRAKDIPAGLTPTGILCSGAMYTLEGDRKLEGGHAISFTQIGSTWFYADDNWGFAMPLRTADGTPVTFEQLTDPELRFSAECNYAVEGKSNAGRVAILRLTRKDGSVIELGTFGPFAVTYSRGVVKDIEIDRILACDLPKLLALANSQLPDKTLIEDTLDVTSPSLTHAVERNDIDGVRHWIARGANVNAVVGKSTFLLNAIRTNNLDVARELLRAGADINARGEFGGHQVTPLQYAVLTNTPDSVQFLLANGADPRTAVPLAPGLSIFEFLDQEIQELQREYEERKADGIPESGQVRNRNGIKNIGTIRRLLEAALAPAPGAANAAAPAPAPAPAPIEGQPPDGQWILTEIDTSGARLDRPVTVNWSSPLEAIITEQPGPEGSVTLSFVRNDSGRVRLSHAGGLQLQGDTEFMGLFGGGRRRKTYRRRLHNRMRGGDITQVLDLLMADTTDSLGYLNENPTAVAIFVDNAARDGVGIERDRLNPDDPEVISSDNIYREDPNGPDLYAKIPTAGEAILVRIEQLRALRLASNVRVVLIGPSIQKTPRLYSRAAALREAESYVSGSHGQAGTEKTVYVMQFLTLPQFEALLQRRAADPSAMRFPLPEIPGPERTYVSAAAAAAEAAAASVTPIAESHYNALEYFVTHRGTAADLTRFLDRTGVSVNARKLNTQYTPLMEAVRTGDPAIVTVLLEKGANPNAQQLPSGVTALHVATTYEGRTTHLIPVLLAAGADPMILTADGKLAVEYSKSDDTLEEFFRAISGMGVARIQNKGLVAFGTSSLTRDEFTDPRTNTRYAVKQEGPDELISYDRATDTLQKTPVTITPVPRGGRRRTFRRRRSSLPRRKGPFSRQRSDYTRRRRGSRS